MLRSSAVVAVGTGLSRITGLLRVGALTYALGTTVLSDAYNLANTTPNIVYELLLGGILSATLVPLFVEHRERGDAEATDALLTVSLVAMLALTAVGMVAAPWIVDIYTSRLPAAEAQEQADVAVPLLRLFLPQIFFYGSTTLATALLHAHRSFRAPAFAPILNNVVVATMLVALPRVASEPLTTASVLDDPALLLLLGLGTTAGIAAMTIALLPALRRAGARFRWRWDPRHEAVRAVTRLSGWTLGYAATNQVALFVVLALANGAGAGSVSAYTYGFIFFQLPHGLVAVSLMTTLLPALSSAAGSGDRDRYRLHFGRGLRLLIVVMVPAAVGLALLGRPLVASLLEHGAFTGASSSMTGDVVIGLAVGLPAFSVYLYVLRGYYARRDTKTPFLLNALENGVNVVLAVLVVDRFGVSGLAGAYSAAYGVAALAAVMALHRSVGGLVGGAEARTVVRTAIAASAMGAALVALAASPIADAGSLVHLLVGVPVGIATFAAVGAALGIEELAELRRVVAARAGRGGS